MYDLDGKEIKIFQESEIENNKMDDIEDTIDLTEIVEEINNE